MENELQLPFDLKDLDADAAVLTMDLSASSAEEADARESWMFVAGEMGWRLEQEETVRGFKPGVDDARPRFQARPRVDTLNLGEDIACALAGSRLPPSSVNVTAQDGRVRLTGCVSCWNDVAAADAAAWAAPGAAVVQNDLLVRAA